MPLHSFRRPSYGGVTITSSVEDLPLPKFSL